MSREDLSDATYYSVNEYEIEQWEDSIGEPTPEKLKSLANAFDMTMDELYQELYNSECGEGIALLIGVAITVGHGIIKIGKHIKNRFTK